MPAFNTIQQMRLDGKVSLVTGASRGLGLAMAEALAGAGSDVVLTGRHRHTLQEVATAIHAQTGRKAFPLVLDQANLAELQPAVDTVMREFGRIDVLINNAGINQRLPALEYTEEAWDTVTDVNLKGVFFLTQKVGQVMAKQKHGKIINNLSVSTALGLPTVIAYTAAKAGLLQLTKLLAVEWAEHNIQVNGIAPGFFRTELTKPVQTDVRNNWIINRTPMRRWGEPEELAGAALFLASPASDFVTGQVLFVDGGMTAGSDWRRGV
jgi:NAD(P)-dependent dehydrogenase (short-subunit alcohol dehydrogenase family)